MLLSVARRHLSIQTSPGMRRVHRFAILRYNHASPFDLRFLGPDIHDPLITVMPDVAKNIASEILQGKKVLIWVVLVPLSLPQFQQTLLTGLD